MEKDTQNNNIENIFHILTLNGEKIVFETQKDYQIWYEYQWKYDPIPSKITDEIYLGNKISATNTTKLKEFGITHIVVCGDEFTIDMTMRKNFKYLQIKIGDVEFLDIKQFFPSCYDYIKQCIDNKGKVLVHCSAGISRSSSVVCSFLIKNKQISFEEAMEIIWKSRIVASPNRGFEKQLKEWYQEEVENEKK